MRVANWPLVLAELVEVWRHRKFEYGSSDCLQLAGEFVLGLTGVDHRHRFPIYANAEEAEQIMAKAGGVHGILTRCLGRSKPVAQAMRGDIVLVDFGLGMASAICLGLYCCAPGADGLKFQPTANARLAWGV